MATTFSTAPAMSQHAHAPYQQHAFRKSTQYSPTSTTMNTPTNVSPTSPRNTQLPLARHQGIYQPRTAIGIPAALRKTEKPGSKSPPKVDSGMSSPSSGWNVNGGFSTGAQDGHATPIGNEDMQSLYNDTPMSPVAGPITRNHWQVRCFVVDVFFFLSLYPVCRFGFPFLHSLCRSWPRLGTGRVPRMAGLASPLLRTWSEWIALALPLAGPRHFPLWCPLPSYPNTSCTLHRNILEPIKNVGS